MACSPYSDYRAIFNEIVVSANNKETAINTAQTLDTKLLVTQDSILNLVPRREANEGELTGKEEADSVYDLGYKSTGNLNFNYGQAQHFGFMYAYGLGAVSTSVSGSGYIHTITPISTLCHPSFTAAMRIGKTIFKRRYYSFFVDTVTATFERGNFATISGVIMGTGRYDNDYTKEEVTDGYDSTSLTLSQAVEGSNATERLNNVQHVRVSNPTTGAWEDVTVTAVSADTAAVLTITAPGIDTSTTTFEVIYRQEAPAWATFPSKTDESPLQVNDLEISIGGLWNGTTYSGGHTLAEEVSSIEHNLNNQQSIEYRIGGNSTYAGYQLRQGRIQTLTLNREARDVIFQQRIEDNEYFTVRMLATGSEFATGENYKVEMIFPRCNILDAPLSADGIVMAEAGDLRILEDDTYGSAIIKVTNQVATYAA